jgi:hypothetical protein
MSSTHYAPLLRREDKMTASAIFHISKIKYGKEFQDITLSTELLGFRTLSIVRILMIQEKEQTRRFGNWICFRPQVRVDTYSVGSLRKS